VDFTANGVEINVSVGYFNGGLYTDNNFETNINSLFAVGEASGIFGSRKLPGSELTSAIVSAKRAAEHIASSHKSEPIPLTDFWIEAQEEVYKYIIIARKLLAGAVRNAVSENVESMREKYRRRASDTGAIMRGYLDVMLAINGCSEDMGAFMAQHKVDSVDYLSDVFINHDMLICEYVYFHAIKHYMLEGGMTRNAYVILEDYEDFRKLLSKKGSFNMLLGVRIEPNKKKAKTGKRGAPIFSRAVRHDDYVSIVKLDINTMNTEFVIEPVREVPY
jgi:succinate dehydrogenase/fumarate reductase flavoprotein subunit